LNVIVQKSADAICVPDKTAAAIAKAPNAFILFLSLI
jgi:hypothetical protein